MIGKHGNHAACYMLFAAKQTERFPYGLEQQTVGFFRMIQGNRHFSAHPRL